MHNTPRLHHPFRRRSEPERVICILVAESPPSNGKYFYDEEGAPSEPLFAAVLHERNDWIVLDTKQRGLRFLQQIGWVLVDATYEPVDHLPLARRNAAIIRDYPLLVDDLTRLTPDRSRPIILIKKNVCGVLEPRLTADGFTVMNRGQILPFRNHHRQDEFSLSNGSPPL